MYIPVCAYFSADFWHSLVLMLKGMTGIFVFMTVFYGLVNLLKLLFKPGAEKNDE